MDLIETEIVLKVRSALRPVRYEPSIPGLYLILRSP
jgi:hypothetical protein